LRDRLDEIRARGAELVIVGNGAESFARAFREDFALDGPLLLDPELRAYRAAGLRRGRVELLSPRLAGNALRALRSGARQQGVQGDPWQLGGVFVIRPGGELAYRQASREAGDHPPVDEILAALDEDAPAVSEDEDTPLVQRWLGHALGRIVDPLVVPSFDRTGFRIHSLAFDAGDLDVDLSETSLALADLGAEVVLLCRNAERGEQAVQSIREQTGNPRVSLEPVDLSDLASVRAAAERLASSPVDVLVHNAGVLPDERVITPDGLELTFATHVVGPFLLTRLLRGALEKSADGRVVWVSSGGMYTRRLNLADPSWRRVVSNAMHPGWADTPAVESSLPGFHRLTRQILRTPAEGADTVVWLAASQSARAHTGRFFFDREPRRTHWLPFTRESEADRRALWRMCETLCEKAER
jgi:NAD(P)-dependent dehydrogenase (short-subunit alcohol dehydrogenase family)